MSQKPTALADELLSQLLEIPNLNVGTPKMLSSAMSRRLKRRKVLIVIDDVNSFLQLEHVIGDSNHLFGPGSRVIVTSRDRQVLNCRCDAMYEVTGLDYEDSFQLFKSHAFRDTGVINMDPSFIGLSMEVIKHANGNPLGLKVLGCDMFKKDKEDWESALRKLKDSPHREIQNILKISYDGLEWHEQQILLDIACVFKGWPIHDVEVILDAKHGIGRLRDKSLVTANVQGYDSKQRVEMHDLIQQMCKDIVLDENRWDPRKRSRLWRCEDILQVLNKSKGAKRVEALSLDMSSQISHLQLSPKIFEEMDNLKLLHFYCNYSWSNNPAKLHLPQGLEYLPSRLRLLHWDLYPSPSLPFNFRPESLVHLTMHHSSLTQLWDGDNVHLAHLKVCDLSGSEQLIRIMDFSGIPNLEELILIGCSSLVEIPSSIQFCRKLTKMRVTLCPKWFSYRGSSITNNDGGCSSGNEIQEWFDYKSSITNNGGRCSSSIIVVPMPLHDHHHHIRRRAIRSWTFAHVIVPPFPDPFIRYCEYFLLREPGVCVHIVDTDDKDLRGVEAAHVLINHVPNGNVNGLKHPPIWAQFEIPIPGVQVIQSGVHLTFADDDDDFIATKEDHGEGAEEGEEPMTEQTNSYMMQDEFEAIVNFMKQNDIWELDTNQFTNFR
ncbi:hypothetical protein Tsubulata_029227 [Turnera subulata]|uniref:NB-ARC domain-containing protein n=1 Tax=Turnera subulata TaxID=218843 RepID=A0A9Q0FS01_9ROSI|nr:hypothetical protein Tsubulata_029227 [Turnera subulata]